MGWKGVNKYGTRNWYKSDLANEDILCINNESNESEITYMDIYSSLLSKSLHNRRDSGYGLEHTGSYFHGASFGGIDNYYEDMFWNSIGKRQSQSQQNVPPPTSGSSSSSSRDKGTEEEEKKEEQKHPVADNEHNSNQGKIYRFWDISSQCKPANRNAVFRHIPISCFVFLTSPVFCYQASFFFFFFLTFINCHYIANFLLQKTKKNAKQILSLSKWILSLELFKEIFVDKTHLQNNGSIKEEDQSNKNMLAPVIVLLNKCDLFQKDIAESDPHSDSFKSLILSFPDYDGGQSYEESSHLSFFFFDEQRLIE
ncbi:hypothetical protein RFI_17024 [Reticulomyxa filosa]|uniref:Uncharacterized protein n=1 Tax=Reticulomyxa filosa TaxID=46433 RepID=X6N2R5_RETFI|nr:hypothetical protein RFI_17024 [Reticulomyxa filosa]|eukprot:ETO20193.1 hypothetical protein RFI_17024 [Reticulomyxa filosa]